MDAQIKQVSIIGVGLIGGSLAAALMRNAFCEKIIGVGRNEASLQKAKKLAYIHDYALDYASGVADADMIVIATPITAISEVLRQIKSQLKKTVTITDVGSVKGLVVDVARYRLADSFANFVPGHPIAGTEKSGVSAAFAELFDHHQVILTPLPETRNQCIDQVRRLWQCCRANVIEMEVEHHDAVLAATSHLPHVLAYTLVDTLAKMDDKGEIFDFAAGGFKDFTRIASSDPSLWKDISLANKSKIIPMINNYVIALGKIKQALEENDEAYLQECYTGAKTARDKLIKDQYE